MRRSRRGRGFSGYAFGVAPCGALNFATGRFAAYCFSDS